MRVSLLALSLSVCLPLATLAVAGEKDDAALARAPAAVRATVAKALGTRTMAEFGRESVGGVVVYEIGFKVDGVDHALVVSEAGALLFEEADVEVDKLPPAVAAAVRAAHPDGKVVEAAIATAGEAKFYLIDVKLKGETRAVRVDAAGKVLADDVVKPLPAEPAGK